MIPQEVLAEIDLLDEDQRAQLAGICLNTIDVSEHMLVQMFAEMEAHTLTEFRRQYARYFAAKKKS